MSEGQGWTRLSREPAGDRVRAGDIRARQVRMNDERRERLAKLEAAGGKLDKLGYDAGFLRTVKVVGTQEEAARAQRVLDQAEARAARKQAKRAAKSPPQQDDGFKSILGPGW